MVEKRLVYPDLLRVIASFAVILIHVTSRGIGGYGINTSVWSSSVIINSLSRWSVPLFFMVSGMFFLDPQKKVDTKKLYTQSIWRIVMCIVVWGFLYGLLDQYLYSTLTLKSVFITLYGIVTGHTGYHLWFLYTLLMLYVAVPALRVFTKHATKQQLDYALAVWFVFSIVVGQINAAAEVVLSAENWLPYEPMVLAGYTGYFLLGYRLKAYTLPEKTVRLLYLFAAISAVAMPLGNVALSRFLQHDCTGLLEIPLGVGSCFIAAAFFVFTSRLHTEMWPEKAKTILSILGERMFGVYLVHVFFVYVLFRGCRWNLETGCPVFSTFMAALLVWTVSLLVSWFLSKALRLKNIV